MHSRTRAWLWTRLWTRARLCLHCRAGDGAGAMEGAEGFAKLKVEQADAAATLWPAPTV